MKLYFTKPLLIILLLGISSGLPLALTASTLFTWLAEGGVEKETIGLFASIALPYSLKFLWSPLVDVFKIPKLYFWLGRRRSWIITTQSALVVTIAAMALGVTYTQPLLFAVMALLIAFFSASQDIVIDAYRVESLPIEHQGAGAAMYTFGYRLGMLVSGAGALWLSTYVSWQMTYLVMAAIMASLMMVTVWMPEPVVSLQPLVFSHQESGMRKIMIEPFRDFMTRKGWMHILAFVVLFKLADAFLGIMFNPFLLELGFSKIDIAAIVKVYGLAATIGGSFLGGALVSRFGVYPILMVTGFLHMFTNLLLVALAGMGANHGFLALCVVSENLTAGMGSIAFVAYLSSLCKREYTASQYALLSSLAAIARTMLSTESGIAAEWLGWQGFFAFSSLLAIPSLVLLWVIQRKFGTAEIAEVKV